MMSSAIIQTHFERNKNMKALGITIATLLILFFLLVYITWSLPPIPIPPPEDGIEVNLGNSDQGMGEIAPQIPGPPSAASETNSNPPPTSALKAEPEQNKDVADNNEPDATIIHTSPKPIKKPDLKAIDKTIAKHKVEPIVNPTPAPPKPKAVYKGGTATGNGGNNADSYNGISNQGIAGGNGDQGKINGNPNSDSYTGNGGNGKSGVAIRSGLTGRKFKSLPSFTDDFNENAKVAVDITVDKNGNVITKSINPKGTTTTNQAIRAIALTKASQLKLTAGNDDEQSGTIIFTFKLQE